MAAQFTRGACPVRSRTFVTYGQSENAGSRPPHRLHARVLAQGLERGAVLPRRDPVGSQPRGELPGQRLHAPGRAALGRGPRGARGRCPHPHRRRRRATVRVDILRVAPPRPTAGAGLPPLKLLPPCAGLGPGTYVARYRIKTANGRSTSTRGLPGCARRPGRAGHVLTRTGSVSCSGCSLASPVVRRRHRQAHTFPAQRTARVCRCGCLRGESRVGLGGNDSSAPRRAHVLGEAAETAPRRLRVRLAAVPTGRQARTQHAAVQPPLRPPFPGGTLSGSDEIRPARKLHPAGTGVVRALVRGAHARAGAGLACDCGRRARHRLRPHRVGQDAGRVPLGARPPGGESERGEAHAAGVRVAAEGASPTTWRRTSAPR